MQLYVNNGKTTQIVNTFYVLTESHTSYYHFNLLDDIRIILCLNLNCDVSQLSLFVRESIRPSYIRCLYTSLTCLFFPSNLISQRANGLLKWMSTLFENLILKNILFQNAEISKMASKMAANFEVSISNKTLTLQCTMLYIFQNNLP